MKWYELREIDAFGNSCSYYILAKNKEKAKEIALERGLAIEQLVEINEMNNKEV